MQRRLHPSARRGRRRPVEPRSRREAPKWSIRPPPDVFELAGRVIRSANRERPADAVLRAELRAQRNLAPADAAAVSKAVFAYYRWFGWRDEQQPVRQQIERAVASAQRYASAPDSFSDAELAARAVPTWLPDMMEIPVTWIRCLQSEPTLWLRAHRGQGRGLAEALGDCRSLGEGPLADVLEYRGRTDLFRTAEFHAGRFELQDIASQAVGFVCDPHPGEKWWDACAGEGGKMLHLSELMENKGLIWASDRAAWRLTKLKRRAARAGTFNYRTVSWDGGPRLPTKTGFDGVLVDAPCSGVGTWQRNPHARWTTTPHDVRELSTAQRQLLTHAAAGVKPGGKLVYAACTLTRPETVEVVSNFESQGHPFQRLHVANPLAPGSSTREHLFVLPQEAGGNGMFIAAWTRRAD